MYSHNPGDETISGREMQKWLRRVRGVTESGQSAGSSLMAKMAASKTGSVRRGAMAKGGGVFLRGHKAAVQPTTPIKSDFWGKGGGKFWQIKLF